MTNQSTIGLTVPSFIPRYRVCVVPESRHMGPLVLIRDSVSATAALRPFFAGLDREQFLVCCLDAKHAIIGVNVVSIGSLTLSIVHPREVFKPAILLNSCGVIAAHNHPSGDPTPSRADIEMTNQIQKAAAALNIRLHDHLVIGHKSEASFKALGLL